MQSRQAGIYKSKQMMFEKQMWGELISLLSILNISNLSIIHSGVYLAAEYLAAVTD